MRPEIKSAPRGLNRTFTVFVVDLSVQLLGSALSFLE